MKFLFLMLVLSLSGFAHAAGTVTLQPGESVTLTPGEPITAVCQSANPGARVCRIIRGKTCNTGEISFKIVDQNETDWLQYCFTLQEAIKTVKELRSAGQCY